MSRIKKIEISILFGALFAIFISFAGFDSKCNTIKNGVFRLRVIANSDSEYDQNIKLSVRDKILECSSDIFKDCKNSKQAKVKAAQNISLINKSVNEVLKDNKVKYSFNTSVKKEFFNIREYDNFTLPAGKYDSLVITLGEGTGHNWWCVLFPSVCINTASQKGKLEDVFSEDITDITNNKDKYYFRFKTSEIYEYIKEKMKK